MDIKHHTGIKSKLKSLWNAWNDTTEQFWDTVMPVKSRQEIREDILSEKILKDRAKYGQPQVFISSPKKFSLSKKMAPPTPDEMREIQKRELEMGGIRIGNKLVDPFAMGSLRRVGSNVLKNATSKIFRGTTNLNPFRVGEDGAVWFADSLKEAKNYITPIKKGGYGTISERSGGAFADEASPRVVEANLKDLKIKDLGKQVQNHPDFTDEPEWVFERFIKQAKDEGYDGIKVKSDKHKGYDYGIINVDKIKPQQDYIHLTPEWNINSIKSKGLIPSKEGYQGSGVYFADSIDTAAGTVGGLDENVALRLKKSAHSKYKLDPGFDNEFMSQDIIDPKDLEISTDGKKWKSLIDDSRQKAEQMVRDRYEADGLPVPRGREFNDAVDDMLDLYFNQRGFSKLGTTLGVAGATTGGAGLYSLANSNRISVRREYPEMKVFDSSKYNERDYSDLSRVLYGEANPDINEMRKIVATVLNRSERTGMSPSEVIRQKNAYYGYWNDQAQRYAKGNLTEPWEKSKDAMIQQVMEELRSGKLKDETGGAYYFDHHNKKFSIDRGRPLFEGEEPPSKKVLMQGRIVEVPQKDGFIEGTTKDTAKIPFRLGASLIDTPRVFIGKDPLPTFELPWMGEISSSQRKAANVILKDDTKLGKAAEMLGIVGEAILDVAIIGSIAESISKSLIKGVSKKEMMDAVPTIKRHLTTGKQIMQSLPPESIAAKGGEQAVVNRIKTNIVDGLRAEGRNAVSDAVSKINAKTIKEFQALLTKMVRAKM